MTERGVYLCRLHDLGEGASRGFSIDTPDGPRDVFLVKKDGRILGYLNSCPHTGGPLDWVPDQFLSLDAELIQCATHDARFRIEDGVCVAGPCPGKRLHAVRTVVDDDAVYVDVSAGLPASAC